MIVLGADTHKNSHTIAAVLAGTGEVLADHTAPAGRRGFAALLRWARGVDGERVWALADCRHVSGAFERFLIGRNERVVRVSTRLMANSRRSSRELGKSDRIDAIAVARAALAAGIETLPTAALAGPELDIRLLVDHRERLVRARAALNNDLRWHLHDLWPELVLPGSALFSTKWSARIGRRLARTEQTMRVRIARDELRRCASSPRRSKRTRPRSPTSSPPLHRSFGRAGLRPDRGQARRQAWSYTKSSWFRPATGASQRGSRPCQRAVQPLWPRSV